MVTTVATKWLLRKTELLPGLRPAGSGNADLELVSEALWVQIGLRLEAVAVGSSALARLDFTGGAFSCFKLPAAT